nr:hypothetical protein [Novosphingobium panipatense]
MRPDGASCGRTGSINWCASTGPVTDRTVRIEFSRPGVRAYSFTFG